MKWVLFYTTSLINVLGDYYDRVCILFYSYRSYGFDIFEVRKMKREFLLVNMICYYRCNLGISQSDLARSVGISRNALSLIERGKIGCSAYVAACLCHALNTDFEDLFFLAPRR